MRYLWGGFATALAVMLGISLLNESASTPSIIPLGSCGDVRILSVSLGTNHTLSMEPGWKRLLRKLSFVRILQPPAKGSELRAITRHETLAVWLELDETSGRKQQWNGARAVALLEDDLTPDARIVHASDRIVRLEFPSFARDQTMVPLGLHVGTNTVRFDVRNPRPVMRAKGLAGTLPQTNVVRNTEVILGRLQTQRPNVSSPENRIPPRVTIRAKAQPPPRWFSWRVTTFDDLGNWASHGVQHSDWLELPVLPRTNSVWRVVAEGTEYISAGFLDPLPGTNATPLTPDPRASAYGVQKLLYVNAGTHTLGVPEAPQPSGHPVASPFSNASNSTWNLQFQTETSGILCVTETAPGEGLPVVRVRERLADNRGRIFPTPRQWSITNATPERLRVASFYRPSLPLNATNLEVEVVGTLPPATFFILPPTQSPEPFGL